MLKTRGRGGRFKCLSSSVSIFFNTKPSEARVLALGVCSPSGALVASSVGMSPLSDREASVLVTVRWGRVYSFLSSLSPTCVASSA